jgi:hypothetical protein
MLKERTLSLISSNCEQTRDILELLPGQFIKARHIIGFGKLFCVLTLKMRELSCLLVPVFMAG